MVQSPAIHLEDRETVFIEFTSPLILDDADDPIYPYVPPSLPETISELRRSTRAGSVQHLVLSVPHASRDGDSEEALAELAALLASPACSRLESVKIMGSTYLLNEYFFLTACSSVRTVIKLEIVLNSQADSYSLAAILCAFQGATHLRIAMPCTGMDVHKSFLNETKQALAQVEVLAIDLNSDQHKAIGDLLGTANLRQMKELEVAFTHNWNLELSEVIHQAIKGARQLRKFSIEEA